jgi:hypothetical protein
MFSAIGKFADEEVFTAAFEMGMPKHKRLSSGAAEAGDLTKLKFLCKTMKCPYDKREILASAAEGRSIPLLKFLVKEGCQIDYKSFCSAASAGSIPVLEFLLQQDPNFADWGCCVEDTAMNGHLNVLQWIANKDTDGTIDWNDRDICVPAARSGSIEMMQFLQQRGVDLAEHNSDEDEGEESLTAAAACHEHKHLLLWFKQQGILPGVAAMRDAAGLDMLDMCLFLHTEGCPWGASVVDSAAHNGYFKLVQALHERGCPLDVSSVQLAAAYRGSVHMLQYLLQLPDQLEWVA